MFMFFMFLVLLLFVILGVVFVVDVLLVVDIVVMCSFMLDEMFFQYYMDVSDDIVCDFCWFGMIDLLKGGDLFILIDQVVVYYDVQLGVYVMLVSYGLMVCEMVLGMMIFISVVVQDMCKQYLQVMVEGGLLVSLVNMVFYEVYKVQIYQYMQLVVCEQLKVNGGKFFVCLVE